MGNRKKIPTPVGSALRSGPFAGNIRGMSPDTPDPSPDAAPPAIAFRGYRLYPVYLRITDAERAEVIALWQDAHAFQDMAMNTSAAARVGSICGWHRSTDSAEPPGDAAGTCA